MKYQVTVKPGSSQEKVVAGAEGLIVYLQAKPHDGEANTALVKLLARHFGVAKSQVVIVRGGKSRKKVIEIVA